MLAILLGYAAQPGQLPTRAGAAGDLVNRLPSSDIHMRAGCRKKGSRNREILFELFQLGGSRAGINRLRGHGGSGAGALG
jgi:hypothetical protein